MVDTPRLVLGLLRRFAADAIAGKPLPSSLVRFFLTPTASDTTLAFAQHIVTNELPRMTELLLQHGMTGPVRLTSLQILRSDTRLGIRLNDRVRGEMVLYYNAGVPNYDWRLLPDERSKYSHLTMFWGSDSPRPLYFGDSAVLEAATNPRELARLHYWLAKWERPYTEIVRKQEGPDFATVFAGVFLLGREAWMDEDEPSVSSLVTKVQTALEDVYGSGIHSLRSVGPQTGNQKPDLDADIDEQQKVQDAEHALPVLHRFESYDSVDPDHDPDDQTLARYLSDLGKSAAETHEAIENTDLIKRLMDEADLTKKERTALTHMWRSFSKGLPFSEYCRQYGLNHKSTDRLYRSALAKLRASSSS